MGLRDGVELDSAGITNREEPKLCAGDMARRTYTHIEKKLSELI